MIIAILGAGAYGTALGEILIKNGYSIRYYDPKFGRDDFIDVINGAEMIMYVAPSGAAPEILPKLPSDIPLVIASKGFLTEQPFSRFSNYMVFSGAGYADDIKAGSAANITVTDRCLLELFKSSCLKLDFTTDRRGVLMCGALKNAYAIMAGMRALERGTKEWLEYLDEAGQEIKSLLLANGCNPDTFDLGCGRADLELTCGLPSRNYRYGLEIHNNLTKNPNDAVEGIIVLRKIKNGEILVPQGLKTLSDLLNKELLCH